MRAFLLATATLLLAPCAYAQTVVNEQTQTDDAHAQTEIEVGSAYDAAATAIAGGNVVTASGVGSDIDLRNEQDMDGDTSAATNATVWHADGVVAVAAASVANGATVSSENGDTSAYSEQYAHGDTHAETRFTGGDATHASTSASASGAVLALSAENGDIGLRGYQENTGAISANVEADHCCVAGQAASSAISSANNMTIGGYTSTVQTETLQRTRGASSARVDLYAGYATDASANATANANAITIENQWGYVNADIDQVSIATVSAQSYVTLGGDFLGYGSAGAYGVGNQAIVGNVGSDTVLDVSQINRGDVSADAALVGEGGDAALASAAAYGNNTTGYVCGYCDANAPSLSATNDQLNTGNVSASASVESPYAHTIAATATAIGNAATFQVRGPGG